jgi:hypothetical protein
MGQWRNLHDVFAEDLAADLEHDDGRRGPYKEVEGNPFRGLLCPFEGCRIRKAEQSLRLHIERLHEPRHDRVDPERLAALQGKLVDLVLTARRRKAG